MLYPGLPSHPGHAIAARQMRNFGGMVSFLLEDEQEAVDLVARTKIWKLAESLGGVESLIEHPARMTHASTADAPFAVPPTLIRLSVGIESAEDLIEDLDVGARRMTVEPIDLHHSAPGIIGCYLVETDDGPALFDCGPTTCVRAPEDRARASAGSSSADVRHLLLSHIHLDHAGAAGALVREHPTLQVHVSEVGAPHVIDPSKLEASARRLYGDAFDELWGELVPVPPRTSTSSATRSSASSAFRHPATPGITCRISTAAERSTRAMQRACESEAAGS